MNISETAAVAPNNARWRIPRIHLPAQARTAILFVISAAIGGAGVPTIVFGPGSIRQAHTADEFIDLSELKRGADLFQAIAQTGLL